MTVPGEHHDQRSEPEEPVVVRDRRKIDPDTGELRQEAVEHEVPTVSISGDEATELGEGPTGESSDLENQLADRTADLQRVQAEYANYRRRVDRDRDAAVNDAKATVAGELLPVLDDVERAEAHGDLTGAFKAVGDKLVDGLRRSGLEAFGVEGEAFDPSVHEAVQHTTSSEVDGPTVTMVLRRGYRLGDKVVRAAMVGVTDHEPTAAPADADGSGLDASQSGELPVDSGHPANDETSR